MNHLDYIARANQRHWTRLAAECQSYTTPWLELDIDDIVRFATEEHESVDEHLFQMYPARLLRDVAEKDILCLATAGGQQSAAFGLLGAKVTVVDLTEAQLEGDRRAAAHYGYDVTTILADMRDLSALASNSFDLVFQAPSLGWVPDVRQVYRGVVRLLRPGGRYRAHVGNPANAALEWDGEFYRVTEPYAVRDFPEESGAYNFRHSMSDLFNGLVELGLTIEQVIDHPWGVPEVEAESGSWAHEMAHNVAMIIVARADE